MAIREVLNRRPNRRTLSNMNQPTTSETRATAERVSQVIFQHAARISREKDISRLLQLNADLARDLTGSDRCSVWLLDEAAGQLWTEVAHGMKQIRIPAGTGIVGACVAEDRTVIVNDAASDLRFLRRVDDSSGYQTESVLAVPLRADEKVIGAMQVLNKPGGFSEHDAELLSFMALYAASGIQSERLRQEAESARLMRRELDLAREVQCNLLPGEPKPVRGLEYAGYCRPAKFVGGDYYDFLELGGGLFSVTLGDVSGKGIAAAVLMASIQVLLRSHLLRQPLPVAGLIAEVSHIIYRCSSADRYSTLFCGVLNAERTVMTYVSAGNPPPLIVRSAARIVERLEGSGFPVGIFPNAAYEEQSASLLPGDILLCMSDGISEVSDSAGEMWDEREIEQMILDLRDSPVSEIVKAIIQRVEQYSAGTDQHDDMTIAAIRIG